MTGRIIDTEADLREGAEWLAARDAGMARAYARCGLPPLRRRPAGFATLMQAIVGQQVSVASAAAIWSRLEAGGLTTPAAVVAAGETGLREAGLSRPKIRYALGLAAADVDFAALRDLPDDAAIARLVDLPGIGPWTAEIYALTALGRCDVLPAGDLALQEGARMLYGLADRPGAAALRATGEGWRPWRAVAARLLWAYYAAEKTREGTL